MSIRCTIGVLALQGGFAEHIRMLTQMGVACREVRLPGDLEGLDGLILPGGESTTMGKLAISYSLMEPLRRIAREIPVWGTCAGAVLMARDIENSQPFLGLMDISLTRNAFGRQADSFEIDLEVPALHSGGIPVLFPAVFIRAPRIDRVGNEVEVLTRLRGGEIVAVRQHRFLATSFHPELTNDERFHQYFLTLI